jgi:hypothetical protein
MLSHLLILPLLLVRSLSLILCQPSMVLLLLLPMLLLRLCLLQLLLVIIYFAALAAAVVCCWGALPALAVMLPAGEYSAAKGGGTAEDKI